MASRSRRRERRRLAAGVGTAGAGAGLELARVGTGGGVGERGGGRVVLATAGGVPADGVGAIGGSGDTDRVVTGDCDLATVGDVGPGVGLYLALVGGLPCGYAGDGVADISLHAKVRYFTSHWQKWHCLRFISSRKDCPSPYLLIQKADSAKMRHIVGLFESSLGNLSIALQPYAQLIPTKKQGQESKSTRLS